ncbi:unnamed protein product, partial [Sphacelaria rigidula]
MIEHNLITAHSPTLRGGSLEVRFPVLVTVYVKFFFAMSADDALLRLTTRTLWTCNTRHVDVSAVIDQFPRTTVDTPLRSKNLHRHSALQRKSIREIRVNGIFEALLCVGDTRVYISRGGPVDARPSCLDYNDVCRDLSTSCE